MAIPSHHLSCRLSIQPTLIPKLRAAEKDSQYQSLSNHTRAKAEPSQASFKAKTNTNIIPATEPEPVPVPVLAPAPPKPRSRNFWTNRNHPKTNLNQCGRLQETWFSSPRTGRCCGWGTLRDLALDLARFTSLVPVLAPAPPKAPWTPFSSSFSSILSPASALASPLHFSWSQSSTPTGASNPRTYIRDKALLG